MTSLIAAIGEGSSITADVLRVQRAFVFRQPLFLGRAFISEKDPMRFSHLAGPLPPPHSSCFNTAPETGFTLSFNEDISKQLGYKSKNQRALCSP